MARGFSLSRGPTQPAATPAKNEQLSSSRVWTPLRESHFEPPLLSSRERAYLVRKACEASLELVVRARSAGGPIAWRHIEKNNAVQIYTGSLRATATNASLTTAIMCGVTSVPGTVTEVASLFQLGSTRQMKEFARAHREWFYDGVVLYTLAAKTKEKPLHQVTAKWTVMQMPQGLPHRDFCFLECQDKFIDSKGRKGWVLSQHSIKLPGCNELKREFGFIRGSLYHSGFVVVESEERAGHVDVIHMVQLNLKEHTPVSGSLLRARVMFVVQVRNMLRSKRLNEQRYLSDLELVPRKYRVRCVVCQDSFSLLLLRKLNCRKCGEVVCAACSKEFPIENPAFAATKGQDMVRKLRICMHCFQVITNAPKPTSALVEPPHASTMSMSFLGYHDDEQQASLITVQADGQQGHQGGEEPVKIYLQSMRRDKASRHRMSSTLPIADFGGVVLPSNLRHRTRKEPDEKWSRRAQQQYRQQQGDLNPNFSPDYPQVQRPRSSDFRPSQSLSLDGPGRGKGRNEMQRPGTSSTAAAASIFDRPVNMHYQTGMPRSRSSDMLLDGSEHNMSNFSRLQALSSRERLLQLQLQDNCMTRSSVDHRMPDAYMSALEQASRDKLDFDAPPLMSPSDLGAFRASLDDHSVISPDFGPYDLTLDGQSGPLSLGASALTKAASGSPFDHINLAAMPPTAPRDGKRERELRSRHGREFGGERMMYSGPPHVPTSASHEMKVAHVRETDEDSETSMGASDDEEDGCTSAFPLHPPIDDDAEESKGHGLDQTLTFPSMTSSSSANKPTNNIYERPSLANSSTAINKNQVVAPNMTKHRLAVKKQQLQPAKKKDLTDYEYHETDRFEKRGEQVSEKSSRCDDDGLALRKHSNGVLPAVEHALSSPNRIISPDVSTVMTDNAAIGNQQTSGDNIFESHLRASNDLPLSTAPQSSTHGSSIRSINPDMCTPSAAISSSSSVANDSYFTTSASLTADDSDFKLAAVSLSDDFGTVIQSPRNSELSPYVPGRFSTLEQLHKGQNFIPGSDLASMNYLGQNGVGVAATDNFQLDALDMFDIHQDQKILERDASEDFSRLQISDKRSRKTTRNNKVEQMHRD